MVLSNVSIRRPVFTIILSGLLMLFGVIAYPKLGVDMMPKIDSPYVTISVIYRGADPDVVENRVIKPIEDAVSTISGVKNIRASAAESFGMVIIEFEMNVPADRAAQDVRDKLARVQRDLPDDADAPIIEKLEIGSAPVVSLALKGPPEASIADVTYVAEQTLRPRLQRFQGVGTVDLLGEQTRGIHVIADPQKLRAYNLTLSDVAQIVPLGNMDVPGGRVTEGQTELLIKTHGEAPTVADLANLVLASPGGSPVRLKDVAQVVDTVEEARTLAAFDGERALTLYVRKQSDANSVAVAEEVVRALEAGEIELPPGYSLEVVQNGSVFTRRAIESVVDDLILGAILAVLVILLFLRNLRATFIASLALPTSVVATFGVMQALDFTMNNLTMLALSLSIGMLIDDAIVVLENIHRHLEMGKGPFEAARDGVAEIGLAVLATTLSVVAVFVPVAFMEGIIGRFFYEFGVTVAVAMLISLFVSFTLTPMASAKLLGHHKEGRLAAAIGRGLDALDRGYRVAVGWTLRHRLLTIAIGVVSLVVAVSLAKEIPSEFRPRDDNGELDVPYSMPEGTSLEATYARGQEIARVAAAALPEDLRHVLLTVGAGQTGKVNEGNVFLKLTGSKERSRSQDDLSRVLRRAFGEAFPGADMGVTDAAIGGSASAAFMARPLNLALRGDDSTELRQAGQDLIEALRKQPGYVDLSISDKGARPQFGFRPDRDKVAAAGLQHVQVAMAIRTAINGAEVSEFREGSDRYKVVVRAPERYRHETSAVLAMPLRGPMGNLVEVGELVEPLAEDAPAQIDREDRVRQITILGSLEGIALGEAQAHAADIAKTILPPSVTLTFGGQGKVMKESFGYLVQALILAIILIYMVLAAQFESFLHPFTIMVSLPLSLIGALGLLYLSGKTMNIMTFIGIIMLMGLVTKNAILLVDRANQRLAEGDSIFDAMVDAGATRLRPILMTSAAMIFGMFPVVLALGEGSEGRVPMGVVVIGGLVTSTILTLLVVPAVYSLFESGRALLSRRPKPAA